jgi:peptide/nickel transport system permease protein
VSQVFLRQAILGVLVVLSALTLTFILVRFSGDPTSIILPQDATAEQRDILRQQLGLNDSLAVQYLTYIANAATGDFGKSYFDSEAVTSIVMRHLPNTLLLAGASLALACVLALPLGVLAAVWRDGFIDRMVQVVAVTGASMPSFWVGLLLIQMLAVGLNLFPTHGTGSPTHLVLPAVTLAIYAFPSLARLTRSSARGSSAELCHRGARERNAGDAGGRKDCPA